MWWFSYNTYVIDDRQVWTYRGKMCVLWRITDYVKDGPIRTDGHNTFVLPWSDDDTADDTWTERRLVVYVINGSLCNWCNTGNMWLGYTHVGGKRVKVWQTGTILRYSHEAVTTHRQWYVDRERRLVIYVRFNHNVHNTHATEDRQTIDGTQCTVFSNNTIQYNTIQ